MIDKSSRVQKYEDIFPEMLEDLKKLREENGGGTNKELAKKAKKAQADLKVKSKALEEASKREEMLTQKVAQEISARAKAEADSVMLSKCVEALQSVVDMKGGSKEKGQDRPKIQEKCTFIDKPGGCSKGARCKFVHPESESNKAGPGEDCAYWMEGHCKYSNSNCRKEHKPEKKGFKP